MTTVVIAAFSVALIVMLRHALRCKPAASAPPTCPRASSSPPPARSAAAR